MSIICSTGCVNGTIDQPDWNSYCADKPRSGGVSRFLFLKKDANLAGKDLNNFEDIKSLICSGDLAYSGKLLGTMPDAADTMQKTTSCDPEKATSRVWTFTAKDMENYNDSDVDRGSEYDFWNDIRANNKCFLFMALTCDERLYFFESGFSIKTTEMIPENSTDSSMFNHTVTVITSPELVKPYFPDGLAEWLDEHSPVQACYYNN